MKTFCKLTAQSPAASYVPLPRFLLQDEALRDISNDANVLYALLLDGVCPQFISRSLICRWFRRAVLPQQPKLEQAILSPKKLRRCEVCGKGILARSGRTKYCPACAKEVHRQQKAKSARKRRSDVEIQGRKALELQAFPHRQSRAAIRFPSRPRNSVLSVYISAGTHA